jgi:hypothetical protein
MTPKERKKKQEEERRRKNAEILRQVQNRSLPSAPGSRSASSGYRKVTPDKKLVEAVFGKQPAKPRDKYFSDLIDRMVSQYVQRGIPVSRDDLLDLGRIRGFNEDELVVLEARLAAAGMEIF